MYQRSFSIYPYMANVPFRLVVTALYEHYRAVELIEIAERNLENDALNGLQRQFIHGLGSRLFEAFSACRADEYAPDAKRTATRTEHFPGVIRSLDMDALLLQTHQLLGDLVPRLREADLRLCDLYEGQSLAMAFLPTEPGHMPERLFWMRALGLNAIGLLSACLKDNARDGENDACPIQLR